MMTKKSKIVLVGGGSNAWAPKIVKDMMLTESISDSEFVLYDIDRDAAELVLRFLETLNRRLKTPASFVATDNRAEAFEGAGYFIVTISTGGLDAMAHDLTIPETYGIFHTVGDTSGPGGWARLMRNYGAFKDLAEAMNRHAPGAMVLNYSNPMTPLTRILCRLCDGPVVGLCHGLFENLTFLKRFYHLDSEDDVSVRYAGLNHFFWITEARTNAADVLPDLLHRLDQKHLTDLLRDSSPDPMGFTSNRELADELFRTTGIMPYLGDRHTCEFFPGYITNRKNMEKYKLLRTSIEERRKNFDIRQQSLENMMGGEIEDKYLERSRETAADIIAAHAGGRPFIDVGNVPNIGQVDNLPHGAVLETAVRVDRNGFSPIAFGSLPEPVRSFVAPYVHVFDLAVEACFRSDRTMALQALRMDPICSHLNGEQVRTLGNRLLHAHRDFVSLS